MQNIPGAFDYNIPQPRFGMTYTVNPNTVLRASYGRYNEQPSAAYEQYNGLQQNLPDTLAQFYALGFTTPGHEVAPSVSYNSDLSIEHHFPGTDMSFKLSPFLRQTQDQIENFYINYTTGLVSGLNAGYQTSRGFELQVDKGDFNRNGFAGQLSFAYTYATVKYSLLPNGTSVLSPINSGIAQYNAYTKACAPGGSAYGKKQFGESLCSLHAAAAFTRRRATRLAVNPTSSCKPGDVANPYWKSPAFSLFDPSASYLPFSIFPGPIGSGVNAYNYPYVATLLLNYRHNKFTITPSFQYVAGNRYGAPLTTPGIDPAAGCGKPLAGSTVGDPRYPYGAAGGATVQRKRCQLCCDALDSRSLHRAVRRDRRLPRAGAAPRSPADLVSVYAARHGLGHAGEFAADVLRRSAHAVYLFLELLDVPLYESHRRPVHAAGRQRLQSRRERADVSALSVPAVLRNVQRSDELAHVAV